MARLLPAVLAAGLVAILAAGAFLLAGAGRGGAADDRPELVLWHAYRGAEKATLEALAADYNARQDRVRVRTLAVPFDAYADKISAAAPRGRGPDLFLFAQDRLGGWVEAGRTVEPVGFYMTPELEARFLPGLTGAMTYRGRVYGLPLNFKSLALIYDRDRVAAPPRTTGELVAAASRFNRPAAGEFGFAYAYDKVDFHAPLMNGFGGGVFDVQGRPDLASEANVAASRLLLKWKNEDRILPPEPNSALILSLFNAGRAPMVVSGPWFLGEVDPSVNVGVAPLPRIDEAGGRPMRPWLIVEGVFVSAGSRRPREAFAFAEFLTSDESARRLALEGGQLPANAAVWADPAVAGDPVLAGFKAQYEASALLPNSAEMALVWSPAETAMRRMIRGAADPPTALGDAQSALERSIAALRRERRS